MITKKQREALLGKLRAGHDIESAASALGLNQSQIETAQAKYGREIASAFKTGTARLRSRIMESALNDDNSSVLMKLLEARTEAANRPQDITKIERQIIGFCVHCGRSSDASIEDERELARKLAFVLAKGANLETTKEVNHG